MTARRALEVWGDPIAHSLSPRLHAAAYGRLGLDWTYGRRRVEATRFDAELRALSATFRGLSLTMPLKGVGFAAAVAHDERARATGAVNTLLLGDDGPRGFNTDVGGIVRALGEQGVCRVDRARIIGAGATATSALVALGELGATRVDIAARRPAAVTPLAELGQRLGVQVRAAALADGPHGSVAVTIATLPGDVLLAPETADALAADGGLLLDVVYGHGQTALSSAWGRLGAAALSGERMLLHQALLQVRIFVSGDPDAPLDEEAAVLDAMAAAVTQVHPDAS